MYERKKGKTYYTNRHSCFQREFSRSGPGVYPEPVKFLWHSPTPMRCGSSYECGTLLLRFIDRIKQDGLV